MDYARIYQYRFQGIDQDRRQAVWNEISRYIYRRLGEPARVLDPAAGRGEFIRGIPAAERWAVDEVISAELREPTPGAVIQVIQGNALTVDLPAAHFDAIFVSNFLEHLSAPREIASFLQRMHRALRPGGRIAVLGPNFKFCASEYFDCSDHILALTHVSVEEHLHAAGFRLQATVPRFLPYSFRGLLPPSATLTRLYLKLPIAWRLLGKQFFVLAEKPRSPTAA